MGGVAPVAGQNGLRLADRAAGRQRYYFANWDPDQASASGERDGPRSGVVEDAGAAGVVGGQARRRTSESDEPGRIRTDPPPPPAVVNASSEEAAGDPTWRPRSLVEVLKQRGVQTHDGDKLVVRDLFIAQARTLRASHPTITNADIASLLGGVSERCGA